MAQIGYFSIVLALAISLYGIIAFVVGINSKNKAFVDSAKGAVLAVAILGSVATFVLLYFLMTGDYSIQYVAEYTSNDLPIFYKFSAWWAGNAGSILLWVFVLGWYTVVVAFSKKTKEAAPHTSAILLFIASFFFFVLAYLVNPFELNPSFKPGMDGFGMNPMLQNPGMVFHPVTLYLGYVGFSIPFAYAMTALITKKADDSWIRVTRRWTIIAWMFLSLGNLWGAQWAYAELGWGGYWGWDPVENASFIPWLTGTAFLHSVMVQERKNMLKIWNVVLIAITFVLTLFGTFLVRSGVLSSVHAFSGGDLGRYFLAFLVFMLFASIYLIVDRRKLLVQESNFESFVSKETSFLLNNLVLVGIAFAVFWGTIYPLISEAFMGNKVTVGAPYFNSISAPLGLILFALMGICPLIAWRKASLTNLRQNFLWPAVVGVLVAVGLYFTGIKKPYALGSYAIATFTILTILVEIIRGMLVRHRLTGESYPLALLRLLVRNRRRHGGYIIHLGLVLMLIGITGSQAYALDVTKSLKFGEQMSIGNYKVTFNKLDQKVEGKKEIVYANMTVYDAKKGSYLGNIEPEKVFYPTTNEPSSEVGLYSTPKEDLYIILATWEDDGTTTFKAYVNPLVFWLWFGGYVLVFGTLFALWPGKGSQAGSKYVKLGNSEQV
ncbi:MAG TPA: heme lyase CcmF/NrfE family subunit [Candidatus Deferrimicrobium sp.]|nr:heme lyase CcmF/NrfE family subunit [Candidatus Deferrimicrobium sp.]